MEVCVIPQAGKQRLPGVSSVCPFALGQDPDTGYEVSVTYAERFKPQYRQFKERATQTKSGTPLAQAPFLTAARQAELRALNIYIVEQLANIDGQELKNLGPYGRDLKNQAIAYIEQCEQTAPTKALAIELEKLKARNEVLEEDNALMQSKLGEGEGEFATMSNDALKEYIRVNAGAGPVGQPNRRTLVRMAFDCRPDNPPPATTGGRYVNDASDRICRTIGSGRPQSGAEHRAAAFADRARCVRRGRGGQADHRVWRHLGQSHHGGNARPRQ